MSEKDFNEWLESIEFVDKDGELMDLSLEEDESDDPEFDREGE